MISKNILIILIIVFYLIYIDIINLELITNNSYYKNITSLFKNNIENINENNNADNEEDDDLNASEDTSQLIHNLHSELISKNNRVYLDITIDNKKYGKLIFELFTDVVPKTCDNFSELCKNKAYKDIKFHRLIKDFCIQGGDITNNDGTGGISIYGPKFKDENFKITHDSIGILSMANSGPDTNNSQFFITLGSTEHLDNKHVAFGKCISGLNLIKNFNNYSVTNETPDNNIIISDCGII